MKLALAVVAILLSAVASAQVNPFENKGAAATVPAIHVMNINAPSDACTTFLSPNRAIWVGSAGNLAVKTFAGENVIIVGVPNGSLLPLVIQCVLSTGTTATSIQIWW